MVFFLSKTIPIFLDNSQGVNKLKMIIFFDLSFTDDEDFIETTGGLKPASLKAELRKVSFGECSLVSVYLLPKSNLRQFENRCTTFKRFQYQA